MNNGFLRVAAANPEIRVADTSFNADRVIAACEKAQKEQVDVLVFPELCLTGSTCGDLFLQNTLTDGAQAALRKIADATKNSAAVLCVGLPVVFGNKLYNACAVLQHGEILGVVPKTGYAETDERRCFADGENVKGSVAVAGTTCFFGRFTLCCDRVTIGVEFGSDLYAALAPSVRDGALVTVNLAASVETAGEADRRRMLVRSRSLQTVSAYVYAGAGRGESTTDAVYAGHGLIAENGEILAESAPFADEGWTAADIDTDVLLYERARNPVRFPAHSGEFVYVRFPAHSGKLLRTVRRLPFVPQAESDADAESILSIQAEGLRKRMAHTGLRKLLLGVSGGLDSALSLLVCLRALDAQKLPRKNLVALSMPGFGTSRETAENALLLAKEAKADHRIVDICESVTQHLKDMGHDLTTHDAAYENAQARMRTMLLMNIANREGGIAVGTGDLSEEALGWCTYNGDHMSMYNTNASVPKTLVKFLVAYEAKRLGGKFGQALKGVLATDISPELLPTQNGKTVQKTEDIIGPFEQNDFFLYYAVRCGCPPKKVLMYAAAAFGGEADDYAKPLARFYKRFFAAQFKRSCSPDGAKIGFSLSPRGDWRMPSDAVVRLWLNGIESGAERI